MNLKKMIMLVALGYCLGTVGMTALSQLSSRTIFVCGEILFLPMICLLIWFGWVLRDEFKKVKVRRCKNDNTRRNGKR